MAKKATKRKKNSAPSASAKRISIKKHREIVAAAIANNNEIWTKKFDGPKKEEEPVNECKMSPVEPVLCLLSGTLKDNNDRLADAIADLRHKVSNIKHFPENNSKSVNEEEKIIPDFASSLDLQTQRQRILIGYLQDINQHLNTII